MSSRFSTGALLSGSGGPLALHDLTHAPVGLWQLQGDANDSSATGANLAAQNAAYPPNYVPLGRGYIAMAPSTNGANVLTVDGPLHTFVPELAITGDLTFEILLGPSKSYYLNAGARPMALVSHQDNAVETEAANCLYNIWTRGGFNGNTYSYWLQEHDAGVDSEYSMNHYPFGELQHWIHFAARRAANVISFFVNGYLYGSASPALVTPTGGGNGYFRLFGDGDYVWSGYALSAKLIASALTDAQIRAEAVLTMGPGS
jgi:hypothetical protein